MREAQTTKAIRVVHLIGELGYGGSERQLFLLLQHLDRRRFENTVVVFNRSDHDVYDAALEELGITVVRIPTAERGVRRRAHHLYRLLRSLKPALIHSWTVHDNPYAGVVGRLAGVPARWGSLRGSLDLDGFRTLAWPLRRLALCSVQTMIVNSESLLQELSDANYPARKVRLLRNCVPPRPVGGGNGSAVPHLESLRIQPGDRLIGAVGNLRTVKNHSLFIRALSLVLPRYPTVKALIVGQELPQEPGVRARLEAEVVDSGLEGRVLLMGFCADVGALLDRLELLCLTSDSEGMPNVVLEAMAAGVPVVATEVGGVAELVENGETGTLLPAGDATLMAHAIERVLSDRSLGRSMGEKGRKRAQDCFDCRKAAAELTRLYLAAVDGVPTAGAS